MMVLRSPRRHKCPLRPGDNPGKLWQRRDPPSPWKLGVSEQRVVDFAVDLGWIRKEYSKAQLER